MDVLQLLSGTIGLAAMLVILLRSRSSLRHTTLVTAWRWMFAAIILWSIVWTITIVKPLIAPQIVDQLWYAVAILTLCPSIAVLGARRPSSRAWVWFVLLPLLLVLGSPALTAWNFKLNVDHLNLEMPAVIAYGLVLVMGLGNYLGTRFALASLLLGTALIFLVAPYSIALSDLFPAPEQARIWATFCLSSAGLSAAVLARQRPNSESAFDRLWIDYRDWFGIVWARRMQDRINQTAEKEQWPVRLEVHGFVETQTEIDEQNRNELDSRIEQTVRWLLRRFVDPEWIDDRLKQDSDIDQ